ncbi:MAG: tRNA (adenosine(37)-N6)-threonylcarbamoyltransferase complex ATPase subunit type 1 TsaE [Candidatus Omnitrophica bacterium]|nr:tRNA (adenosine(37)-N6)-threonylcarbamoyltransferase complex ATPase subunit type 1 TsaE [Candidatus Omnitrophota bacterium]MDD5236297.1 tRNA (adenosine(37)-N6)-threonylcarbamoyltransferase complex ATPase subunit type 1 TsaE [Candidatus Omnitrophota bacterium]MDD5611345.1 tRNA (adenosine(37)-N6)-threonylcarbamoyltransferase complex ATPase subunit type 1 TsaE [Candidatus Omnitrophota bacterium]
MKIISHSPQDTRKLGRKVSRALKKGNILCLFGEFGSGKTVLAKGIASGLKIKETQVISPSFVLMRDYKIKLADEKKRTYFYHFDFYRLENIKEILDIGYEEFIYSDAISVIEWADRLGKYLPRDYLAVKLSVKGSTKRLIELKAHGENSRNLLSRIK